MRQNALKNDIFRHQMNQVGHYLGTPYWKIRDLFNPTYMKRTVLHLVFLTAVFGARRACKKPEKAKDTAEQS